MEHPMSTLPPSVPATPPSAPIRFAFRGLHGRPGVCDVEFVRLSDGRTLVICAERDDNPGASVTNAAELIATQVCQHYQIDPAALVWVEHYPPGRAHGKTPDWDRVTFQIIRAGHHWYFAEPDWRPMRPQDWLALGLPPRD
jgi:hypothetical protein